MDNKAKLLGSLAVGLITCTVLYFLFFRSLPPKLSTSNGSIHVIGEILDIPETPDPSVTEYADCLSVAKIKVIKVIEGSGVPLEILVAVRSIAERKYTKSAAYKKGDLIELTLLKTDQVEEKMRTMQRIMDIDDFSLDFRYAIDSYRWSPDKVARVSSGQGGIQSSQAKTTSASSVKFEDRRSPHAKQVRRDTIAADISRIKSWLAAHDGDWAHWTEQVSPWRKKLDSLARDSGGGLLKDGIFFRKFHGHVFQELVDLKEEASAIHMIQALHKELDQLGIDLIVVPFPFKEDVNGDLFLPGGPDDGILNPERLHVFLNLMEAGVEVVDLTEALRSSSDRKSLFYPYQDIHPADGGIQVAATVIADRLKRYRFPPNVYGLKPQTGQFTMTRGFQERREKDLSFMPLDPTFPVTFIKTLAGKELPGGPVSSPILILGDSFSYCPDVFGDCRGGNVREHIAYRTGVNPSALSARGSAGQAMSHLALAEPDFLVNRQVVVFIFSPTRLFAHRRAKGSEWKIVPFAEKLSN